MGQTCCTGRENPPQNQNFPAHNTNITITQMKKKDEAQPQKQTLQNNNVGGNQLNNQNNYESAKKIGIDFANLSEEKLEEISPNKISKENLLLQHTQKSSNSKNLDILRTLQKYKENKDFKNLFSFIDDYTQISSNDVNEINIQSFFSWINNPSCIGSVAMLFLFLILQEECKIEFLFQVQQQQIDDLINMVTQKQNEIVNKMQIEQILTKGNAQQKLFKNLSKQIQCTDQQRIQTRDIQEYSLLIISYCLQLQLNFKSFSSKENMHFVYEYIQQKISPNLHLRIVALNCIRFSLIKQPENCLFAIKQMRIVDRMKKIIIELDQGKASQQEKLKYVLQLLLNLMFVFNELTIQTASIVNENPSNQEIQKLMIDYRKQIYENLQQKNLKEFQGMIQQLVNFYKVKADSKALNENDTKLIKSVEMMSFYQFFNINRIVEFKSNEEQTDYGRKSVFFNNQGKQPYNNIQLTSLDNKLKNIFDKHKLNIANEEEDEEDIEEGDEEDIEEGDEEDIEEGDEEGEEDEEGVEDEEGEEEEEHQQNTATTLSKHK